MGKARLEYIGGGQYVYRGQHVGTDWDWPHVASDMGWSIQRVQRDGNKVVHLARRPKRGCPHRSTDGTVKCEECGISAHDFITAAGQYLEDHAE